MRPELRRAYEDAVAVQDACNAAGVIKTLSGHVRAVMEACRTKGDGCSGGFNHHPVIVAFVDKLAGLSGIQHPFCLTSQDAHRGCRVALEQGD